VCSFVLGLYLGSSVPSIHIVGAQGPANTKMVDPVYTDSEPEPLGGVYEDLPVAWEKAPAVSPGEAKSNRRTCRSSPLEEIAVNWPISAVPDRRAFHSDEGENGPFSLTVANNLVRESASGNGCGKELPLSDPNSEIWNGREDAKLAVVIPSKRKGTTVLVSPNAKRVAHSLTAGVDDFVQGKPKGRLWLHSVRGGWLVPLVAIL
jgi:hypothetical protein